MLRDSNGESATATGDSIEEEAGLFAWADLAS
jgi:hypothetical protein